MKKLLAVLLTLAIVFGLCCSGVAFADETKPEDTAAEETIETEAAVEAEKDEAGAVPDVEETDEEVREDRDENVYEDVFAEWNEDATALNTLIEYVETVTDAGSDEFIPPADRIAVFDMDGTLYAELFPTNLEYYMLAWRILKDPAILPDAEMLALGREIRESVISEHFAADIMLRHAIQAARAYAGMTVTEFTDFVTGILVRDADGFEGMTYATAFYLPMIEVVEYLQDNDFKVYILSGSDRMICRTMLEGMLDVPSENIIGMDDALEASGQGDEDGLSYTFKPTDELVRTDKLLIKNLRMNKVLQIAREIGKQPVLSFGNTESDCSMHMYTISNNPYKSAAFMLVADDEQRDYGDEKKAEELRKTWEESGFNVISMRDDFRTIYGDDVVKTGRFRWADELAEDRTPMEDSPEWVRALGEEQNAQQLFVVAGVGETTATVSMHEKDSRGVWKQIMSTPGYIGRNGLGKEIEGDGRTPVGVFSFNRAFGIAEDPGCAMEYHQVTQDDYWSGDHRQCYCYNEMVSIADLPDLDKMNSEHLAEYTEYYQYCLNISYNEEGDPGRGSAIFLHCLGLNRPFTGGCVAIPRECMLTVMQHVRPDCVVVIDSLEKLSPETWNAWGMKTAEKQELQIDYGTSLLYTEEEMDEAIALIREEFDTWEGCELHSIRYAGDDCNSSENIEWLNELGDGVEFTQCIEFVSSFHSPKMGGGAWNPDEEYTGWQWFLGRTDGGDWQLLTWGY